MKGSLKAVIDYADNPDIYFTAVGMIDLPTEEELKALMEEMQNATMQEKATA